MLTWILGYFWSLPRKVILHLEWGHAHAISFRAVAAVSCWPFRGSRDVWLSLEAFPRSFPSGLSHLPPWCELILGVKVEAVQGNLVHLECTETSGGSWNGGTTLEFLSAFLLRGPPLEMRWEPGEFFPKEAGKGSLISSYEGETGLLLMWAGHSFFL